MIDANAGMTRRAWSTTTSAFLRVAPGPDLVDNGKLQAAGAGAEIVDGKAVELDKHAAEGFELKTEDGKAVEAKQVILTLVDPELAGPRAPTTRRAPSRGSERSSTSTPRVAPA